MDVPGGSDRAQMCAGRRAEILEGIGQILTILDHTRFSILDSAPDLKEDQRKLYSERMAIALEFAMGLRQGALALKILETADLVCASEIPAFEGTEKEHRQIAVAEEYRNILDELEVCNERIRELSSQLEAGTALGSDCGYYLPDVTPIVDTLEIPDIIEMLEGTVNLSEKMAAKVVFSMASAGSCLLPGCRAKW
jgi:hypothetical protein